RVIANSINFTVLFAHDQIRVHSGYFFGNQTKLRRLCGVALVVEGYWLKRQNCFARFIHGFDLVLEPPRRAGRAELPRRIYQDWYSVRVCRCSPADAGNKGSGLPCADANGGGLANNTTVANIDVVITRRETVAGAKA